MIQKTNRPVTLCPIRFVAFFVQSVHVTFGEHSHQPDHHRGASSEV